MMVSRFVQPPPRLRDAEYLSYCDRCGETVFYVASKFAIVREREIKTKKKQKLIIRPISIRTYCISCGCDGFEKNTVSKKRVVKELGDAIEASITAHERKMTFRRSSIIQVVGITLKPWLKKEFLPLEQFEVLLDDLEKCKYCAGIGFYVSHRNSTLTLTCSGCGKDYLV